MQHGEAMPPIGGCTTHNTAGWTRFGNGEDVGCVRGPCSRRWFAQDGAREWSERVEAQPGTRIVYRILCWRDAQGAQEHV